VGLRAPRSIRGSTASATLQRRRGSDDGDWEVEAWRRRRVCLVEVRVELVETVGVGGSGVGRWSPSASSLVLFFSFLPPAAASR
jgi:hypothetical protein